MAAPDLAFRPLFARKTADVSVTSNQTLADDADLHFPLVASAVYEFELVLTYDGPAAGDIQVAFTVPSGSTIVWRSLGFNNSTAGVTNVGINSVVVTASGTSTSCGAVAIGTKTTFGARGIVRVGATAGNLMTQWAQLTSTGTATTVFTDSYLTGRRVA